MNTAATLLPLVGFQTRANATILINPLTVVKVYEKVKVVEDHGAIFTNIETTDGTRHLVRGDLLHTRQALQGNPWYATQKLQEFLEDADEYFDDKADADEGHANWEMRLLTQVRTVRSLLREHGFCK